MPRCPRCGAWMWGAPPLGKSKTCSKCGAIVRQKEIKEGNTFYRGYLHVVGHVDVSPPSTTELGEVALAEADAEERWRREHPQYYSPVARCAICQTGISIANPDFCPRCGAALRQQAEASTMNKARGMTKSRTSKRVVPTVPQEEKCIVCNLELNQKDDVAWCLHCGRLAHRGHLVAWLRKKKACPLCSQYLNVEDYV
ncbi:MAG: hypothetical protein WED04_10360 [Promethearchaeati archaeon SRVP18_Atabeyarchaeia-1]